MSEITLGQKRVRRDFSPEANPEMEGFKQKYADIIDYLESIRTKENGREISIAQTDCETSCMYAVKGFCQYGEIKRIPVEKIISKEKYLEYINNLFNNGQLAELETHIKNPRFGFFIALHENFIGESLELHTQYIDYLTQDPIRNIITKKK